MSMHELEEQIVPLVASIIGCPEEQARTAADLFEIGLDSFAFMLLAEDLEKAYNIRFADNELTAEVFRNVALIGVQVRAKILARAG
jgi:acyl carrier protein